MQLLKKKHVLFFTSTNLACNPRCLKEVRLLDQLGVQIAVVAFNLDNWTTEEEKKINTELHDVDFYYLETSRKYFSTWLVASFSETLGRLLFSFFKNNLLFAALAVGKRNYQLLQFARQYTEPVDLIIAHNPATFYPAWWLSKKYNIPFALDIEDYHPGEFEEILLKKSAEVLMRYLIPNTAYTSYASSLIKSNSENLSNTTGQENSILVNNFFSFTEFFDPLPADRMPDKFQLVWFSQFIDYGRGLELLLPILDEFSIAVDLTLIGNVRASFYENELKSRKYVHCVKSLPQITLHQRLNSFDVGLAIEDSSQNVNRNLCITNKLCAYFQAGLYILASDTVAQIQFLKKNTIHGIVTGLNKEVLKQSIANLLNQKELIRSNKLKRFMNASAYNWENESLQLALKWEALLQ